MKNIAQEKSRIRKEISSLQKKYSPDELYNRSEEALAVLEVIEVFQNAEVIFIYNSLNDEVQTSDFIRRWDGKKKFYLPVVVGDDIVFRSHTSTEFKKSSLGIFEPIGEDFTDFGKVDLIVVPGVAFDRKMNRLGRGKGFYDRFLPKISVPKAGICFDFQLLNEIPVESTDIKMDYIISENELIWK